MIAMVILLDTSFIAELYYDHEQTLWRSKTAYIDRLQEHRSRQRKVVQHDLSDESLSFA